jgi:hypothetical protein
MIKPYNVEDEFSFWKNISLIIVFSTITPIVLALSFYSLSTFSNISKSKNDNASRSNVVSQVSQQGVKMFASLPTDFPSISGFAIATDARVQLLHKYLSSYYSPLESYAPFMVAMADKYGVDFRLTTAIAQQESNLCKVIPPGSFNCWGWGIYGENVLGFRSYEEGIETVTKGLREEYLNKGYATLEDIMSKYTPPSKGSWADGVNKFMSEMQ